MGIITTTASIEQQMITGLRSMDILKIFRDHELLNQNDLNEEIKSLIRECTLVTSKLTGLGKSTFIRQTVTKSLPRETPIYIEIDASPDSSLSEILLFRHIKTVSVFYRLFTGFSRRDYFLCKYVPNKTIRMDLAQTLLQSSNQFTSLSVEAIRRQQ
ncbi:unnamed protein product [Rotaria sp. Silwood2]|nr:unnamed protein product [Rotaria sp. Silwood2]CAF2897775.1 unnamed protein product [Rotaria sp. Silwood2]CAF4314454.1 unnamed protein product [Rotaria sp. Silwood2]CAF4383500.1 unnamed protein product [Rotaria sp. Silwood2]